MAKEVYLYSQLYRWSAEYIVKDLNAFGTSEFTMRFNSPGGQTNAGWTVLSKLNGMSQKKKAIVDCDAQSMAAVMLLFFDEVEVNDASNIMFHKAAYPSWYTPSDEELDQLDKINALFKEKIDALPKFPQSLNDRIFQPDRRNNVFLTPDEALEYGVATKKVTLSVAEREQLGQLAAVAMAEYGEDKPESQSRNSENNDSEEKPNISTMTLAELRVQNPGVYQEAVNAGVTAEKKRTKDFLTFIKPKENSLAARSVKAIQDGEQYIEAMAEMNDLAIAERQTAMQVNENADDTGNETADPAEDANRAKPNASSDEAAKAEAAFNEVMGLVPGYKKPDNK